MFTVRMLTAFACALCAPCVSSAQSLEMERLRAEAVAALERAEAAVAGYEPTLEAALAQQRRFPFVEEGLPLPEQPTLAEMQRTMVEHFEAPDVAPATIAELVAEIDAVAALGGGPESIGGAFGPKAVVRQAVRRAALLEEAYQGCLPKLRAEYHEIISEMQYLALRPRVAQNNTEFQARLDAWHDAAPTLNEALQSVWAMTETCALQLIEDWRKPPEVEPDPTLVVERRTGHHAPPAGSFVYDHSYGTDIGHDGGVGFLTVTRIAATDHEVFVEAIAANGLALTYVATVEGLDDLSFAASFAEALRKQPPEIPEDAYCAFCLGWTDPEEPRHIANATVASETLRYSEDIGMRRFDGPALPAGTMSSRIDAMSWDAQRSWEYVCYERVVEFRERLHVSMSRFGEGDVIEATLPMGRTLTSSPMPERCVTPPEGAIYGRD